VIENFLFDSDSSEGSVSGSHSLGESVHIGDDTFVVLETEHFTRAAESLHDFIRDEHNSVLVAESTDSLHEAGVHLEPSISSGDRLKDDSGNFVRSFEKNLIMKSSKTSSSSFLFTVVIPVPVEWEGVHHLDETSLGVVDTPGTGITSSSKGSRSSSVVRTVARHDFRSSSELSGHVEGSLVGLSTSCTGLICLALNEFPRLNISLNVGKKTNSETSRGEEKTVDISRRNFSENLTKSCSDVTAHCITVYKRNSVDLVGHGGLYALGHGVTEVRAHGSRTPIDVPLVVVVIDVDSFRSLDIYRSFFSSVGRGPSVHLSSSNSLLDLFFRPLSASVVSHVDGSSGVILVL
jgi:hypothetical protein